MSPRIENAIHRPSGLQAGSSGPVVTAGSMCRSTRSEWPYRFGPACRNDAVITNRPNTATVERPLFIYRNGLSARARNILPGNDARGDQTVAEVNAIDDIHATHYA